MLAPTLIASFTHGNAVGVILEPADAAELFAEDKRPTTWMVRIGPVDADIAANAEFPQDDYELVVRDLRDFLLKKGVRPPAKDFFEPTL